MTMRWLRPACHGNIEHQLRQDSDSANGTVRRCLEDGRRQGRHFDAPDAARNGTGVDPDGAGVLHRYWTLMVNPDRERLRGAAEVDE